METQRIANLLHEKAIGEIKASNARKELQAEQKLELEKMEEQKQEK